MTIPVVLYIVLLKMVLTFSSLWMKSSSVTTEMEVNEQYFAAIMGWNLVQVSGLFLTA